MVKVLATSMPSITDSITSMAVATFAGTFTWAAFNKAVCVVGVAEVFDKTWFMTVLLALNHGKRIAMAASFTALALHTFLAAFLGVAVAKFVSGATLDFATAGLFAVLAIMYAKDWYYADPETDMIAQGREEAEEGIAKDESLGCQYGGMDNESQIVCAGVPPVKKRQEMIPWGKLTEGFIAVFIAEWGDRTQIAMVGLHSSLPVVPVFLGSLVAFWFLCLSAVSVAAVLEDHKVSEKVVFGLVAVSFVCFALLSLHDGLVELQAQQQVASFKY
jgi:putative Ca2+/H+ antiporter (TMEM165/GDT1 family)